MLDINKIAKDIGMESAKQGDNLVRIDQSISQTKANTSDALVEIKKAATH